MRPAKPHFLLFSQSKSARSPSGGNRDRPTAAGTWQFQLESIDGVTTLVASDQEPGLTQERLELLAVVRGLEALDQPSRVTLITSSRYVSRGIRFGIHNWRENQWRWEYYGEMTPVPNADLWRRVDGALAIHQVECRTWRFDLPEASDPVLAAAASPAGSAAGVRVRPRWDTAGLGLALRGMSAAWKSLPFRSRSSFPQLCPQ